MKTAYRTILFLLAVVTLQGCTSDNPVDSGDDASLIGKWRILTSNGADISSVGGSLDISASQIVESWQLLSCAKTYSYTEDGKNYTTTLQSTNCQQGSDPSNVVGYTATGTYKISKNRLTLNLENGSVTVAEKM